MSTAALDKKLGMSLEDLISSKAAAPRARAAGKAAGKQAPKSLAKKTGAAAKKMVGKKAPISIAKGAAVRDLGDLAAQRLWGSQGPG